MVRESGAHDREIISLLNRIHSGCRFVNFQESTSFSVSSGKFKSVDINHQQDISNSLRNASPPDESHAELGRALGHSYIASLFSTEPVISEFLSSGVMTAKIDASIERGTRIVHELCCGERVSEDKKMNRKSFGFHTNKLNYASAASAFFYYLEAFCFNGSSDNLNDTSKSIMVFAINQWQKWCSQCEEFTFSSGNSGESFANDGYSGGGGIHVLRACLKGYASICRSDFNVNIYNVSKDLEGEHEKSCVEKCEIYESLQHPNSRKFWIRARLHHALNFVSRRGVYAKHGNEILGQSSSLVEVLGPLFQSCALQSSRRHGNQPLSSFNNRHSEKELLVRETLWGCSNIIHNLNSSENEPTDAHHDVVRCIISMMHYLSVALSSYIRQVVSVYCAQHPPNEAEEETLKVLELSFEWLRGVCDLTQTILTPIIDPQTFNTKPLVEGIAVIITTTLPQLSSSLSSFRVDFDLAGIYSSLVSSITLLTRNEKITMANAAVAIRLGTLALNLADDSEIQLVCGVILSIFGLFDTNPSDAKRDLEIQDDDLFVIGGILCSLGCIFDSRPLCAKKSSQMKLLGASILRLLESLPHDEERNDDFISHSGRSHLMDMVSASLRKNDAPRAAEFVGIISSSICNYENKSIPMSNWERRELSLTDQSTSVLLGLSLLHGCVTNKSMTDGLQPHQVYSFIRSLLKMYPRMASRTVSSIIHVLRSCVDQSAGYDCIESTLLVSLEFLASESILSDPHGAHLAWKCVSLLTNDGVPAVVRSSVIRILPNRCLSNKKLFRRIRDLIGKSMVSRDPIIRIAATATLADLAKFDLLRDVEEIISWVQNRLQDEEPAVAYFALVALQYLVVNEELEFDLVIRVLEKRLGVDLCDTQTIMKWDSLILEGFLMFLGTGRLECDEESDHDEVNINVPIVSPQLSKAVSLLLDCHEYLRNMDNDMYSTAVIHRRIYSSLTGYTPQILGLDPEIVRDWDGSDSEDAVPEIKRFLALKSISLFGLDFGSQLLKHLRVSIHNDVRDVAKDILHSVSKLFRTLLSFEDEIHGSFLFGSSIRNAKVGSSKKIEGKHRVPKAGISPLPDVADIKKIFEDDPRSASAIALLYATGSVGNDSSPFQPTSQLLLQISECFCDLENEPLVDPRFQAIQICSLIHCMETVWSSMEQAEESTKQTLFNQVVSDVEEWASNSGEHAYVALAAFALAVDDDSQLWSFIAKIQNLILDGSDNYLFESEDAQVLCLGMVAARLCRTADARVSELIDFIQKSLSVNNRQTCFGAYFGMGLMVKNLASRSELGGSDPSRVWRRCTVLRLLGIFMTEFDACLTESNSTIRKLVECFDMGESSDDLISLCEELEGLSIQVGVDQKFKSILIGLSHTFFALSAINAELMKCVACVLNKLPWGSGKGLVMYSMHRACLDADVFQQDDLSDTIFNCSGVLRKSIADGCDLICSDALFALASICSLSTSNVQTESSLVLETIQKVLSDSSFGRDSKSISALAGCAIVGEVPGLTSVVPLAHQSVKKDVSMRVVNVLNETMSNDLTELKCRDSATIGLGVLCAMKSSTRRMRKNKLEIEKTKQIDQGVDIEAIIQARDGSFLESVLREIESLLRSKSQRSNEDATATNKKLSVLFSSLECIAMPGSFSRVIEMTLNATHRNDSEVKVSSISLLISQLEGRRRIGFDGRGFVDLATRLAKMPYHELTGLIGDDALPVIIKAFPDLLYQLPTSVCDGVLKNLWALCQAEIIHKASTLCTEVFLLRLKKLMLDAGDSGPESKKTISPAVLRTLQKTTTGYIFSDLCKNASPNNSVGIFDSENIWNSYLTCLGMVPMAAMSESDLLKSDIDHENMNGKALCARILPSMSGSSASYRTRKIETFVARQSYPDVSNNDVLVMDRARVNLVASLVIAPQPQSEIEMKESIMNIFEIMLVQGVRTFGLELLAIKVAFWWESCFLNEPISINVPVQRVTKLSSFLIAKNMCFKVQSWPNSLLIQFYDACIADLPFKLALLCGKWKISDDVSNRAKRIYNDGVRLRAKTPKSECCRRLENSLTCLRDIVQYITGDMIL